MNCDILMSYSQYCYYPLWHHTWLKKYRDRFKKIVLFPSDHNRELSFRDFLREHIKETWVSDEDAKIDWFTPIAPDWRQEEATRMLPYSDAEWIFFLEPDFFHKDYGSFLDLIEKTMESADSIGWMNKTVFPYLHPASFFIKRSVLDKTQKDFRAHPEIDGCDHFGMLTRDMENMGAKIVSYQDLGLNCDVTPEADAFHLGGMTSNIIDSVMNVDFKFHRPEIFYIYNLYSRKLMDDKKVPYSPEYYDLSLKVDNVLIKNHPEVVFEPKPSPWSVFFDV